MNSAAANRCRGRDSSGQSEQPQPPSDRLHSFFLANRRPSMHRTTRVILSALLGSLLLSPALSSAAILACPLTLDQADDRQLQDLRRQADEGDACAQFNMGYLSYTQQDYVQSERWYTEAAEQGVARAAFEIAILAPG